MRWTMCPAGRLTKSADLGDTLRYRHSARSVIIILGGLRCWKVFQHWGQGGDLMADERPVSVWQDLALEDASHAIESQLSTADLGLTSIDLPSGQDREFLDNEAFWSVILGERLRC